jgi:triacylglycerol lipase
MYKRFLSLVVTSALLLPLVVCAVPQRLCAAAGNDCPIVLVLAWGCWGRDQLYGYKYHVFGGNKGDLQTELIAAGYPTCTPSLGLYTSTWDRACELYAQLKGGTVDYGLAHSKKFGHARYGRTYPPMIPGWGTIDPTTGKTRKVHLVALCFGGLTSRLLVQLLEKGYEEERASTPINELSPLFAGGHSWVLSCTTLVTPHDGTSSLDHPVFRIITSASYLQFIMDMFAPYVPDGLYDFQMDQWGIHQHPDESLHDFIIRLSHEPALKNSRDFSNYDITSQGIYAFNSWVKAQPDVYYFSLAADATYKGKDGHYHPLASMIPAFYAFSEYMGYHVRSSKPFPVTKEWWPNDGTVNVISQNGPKVGAGPHDAIVNFNGTPQVGKWNFLGVLKGVDHVDVVGMNLNWWATYEPLPWFLNHAALLRSLPQ